MSLPTDKEQLELNGPDSTSTAKIRKCLEAVLAEYDLVLKVTHSLEAARKAAEDAHKAWKVAEAIERRLLRTFAAASSGYQMEIKDDADPRRGEL